MQGYTDLKFILFNAKTQPTTMSTSHVISKYVLKINMLPKCDVIHAIYCQAYMEEVYMSYMRSMASTMQQGVLYTSLTYITGYGCHIANVSYTATMLNGYIDLTFLHISAITQPPPVCTSHVIAI